MVWTLTLEIEYIVYLEAEVEPVRQEKTKVEIHGCSKRGK